MVVFCSHQVAILGECSAEIIECAYQYGRNVGIAFQVGDQIIETGLVQLWNSDFR